MSAADNIRRIAVEAYEELQRAPHGHGNGPPIDAIERVLRRELGVIPAPISPEAYARGIAAIERMALAVPDPEKERKREEEQEREHRERVAGQAEAQKAHVARMERSLALSERQIVALESIAQSLHKVAQSGSPTVGFGGDR